MKSSFHDLGLLKYETDHGGFVHWVKKHLHREFLVSCRNSALTSAPWRLGKLSTLKIYKFKLYCHPSSGSGEFLPSFCRNLALTSLENSYKLRKNQFFFVIICALLRLSIFKYFYFILFHLEGYKTFIWKEIIIFKKKQF